MFAGCCSAAESACWRPFRTLVPALQLVGLESESGDGGLEGRELE